MSLPPVLCCVFQEHSCLVSSMILGNNELLRCIRFFLYRSLDIASWLHSYTTDSAYIARPMQSVFQQTKGNQPTFIFPITTFSRHHKVRYPVCQAAFIPVLLFSLTVQSALSVCISTINTHVNTLVSTPGCERHSTTLARPGRPVEWLTGRGRATETQAKGAGGGALIKHGGSKTVEVRSIS